MQAIPLKYGCNPNQGHATISTEGKLPIEVLSGNPGYINFLDALNGWQLVRELKQVTGMCAAASFKHVSPAGAAVGLPLDDTERSMYFVPPHMELSELATAYVRARGADRMSSFGDFIALSDTCDLSSALVIKREVSDGVIAPGYEPAALELLRKKRNGKFAVIQIDAAYEPPQVETRTVFGVTFTQERNTFVPTPASLEHRVSVRQELPKDAVRDLTIAQVALKYTQSNSVVYAHRGQTIGVGAGQQSRIHCTRLAGDKADRWMLRHAPQVLGLPFLEGTSRNDRDNAIEQYLSSSPECDLFTDWQRWFTSRPIPFPAEEQKDWLAKMHGICLASDAFFPFRDNIDRAARSGVSYICEPGGSMRDDLVIEAANEHQMVLCFTGSRLFHH